MRVRVRHILGAIIFLQNSSNLSHFVNFNNFREEDSNVALTPEMVNAQFSLIDSASVPEEKPKQKE